MGPGLNTPISHIRTRIMTKKILNVHRRVLGRRRRAWGAT